jgi:phage-related baseplate assembly protein
MRRDLELPSDEVTQVATKVANYRNGVPRGENCARAKSTMECRSCRQDLEAFEGRYEFRDSIGEVIGLAVR